MLKLRNYSYVGIVDGAWSQTNFLMHLQTSTSILKDQPWELYISHVNKHDLRSNTVRVR